MNFPNMKKIATSLLAVLFIVTFASAQNKKELKLDSFKEISMRIGGKLYLRQGSPQKVEIEGDREDLEDLEVRIDGDKLIIGKENNWGWNNWNDETKRVNIYVTAPTIEGLNVSGSGDVIAQTKIVTSRLKLNVSGSGLLELEGDVSGDVDADVSGSGRIELKGKCRDFDSHVSGSGRVHLDITVAERAMFGISGSGKIEAAGSAQEVKATISGSGEVRAADLVVDRCDIRISGSGDVEINVNKELDANISGSGTVTYKGNPAHVNSHSSGSGKVRRF